MHLDTSKALISQPRLITLLDVSRSGLDKLRKKDTSFPKPIKSGPHRQAANFYIASEIDAWIRSQIEKRDRA